MYQTLTVRQLTTSTVFKIVACGCIGALVPLFLALGCLSLLGMGSVQWNGHALTGLRGLVLSPLIGLLLALLLTLVVGSLVSLGLWLYSLVRPLQLAYWENDQ